MKIYFDSDKAWQQLSAKGYVATLRKLPEAGSQFDIQNVEVWRHGKFTGISALKIYLFTFGAGELDEYFGKDVVSASGFANSSEWLAEAERLSGKQKDWTLFFVVVPKPGEVAN